MSKLTNTLEQLSQPMKAQTFRLGKTTYPSFGQPKINGVRCIAIWNAAPANNLFEQPGFILRSKEGIVYPIAHIVNQLNKLAESNPFARDIVFDGEVYLVKEKNTTIAGAARNVNNHIHKYLQFVIFDIVDTTKVQGDRLLELYATLGSAGIRTESADQMNWPKASIIPLLTEIVNNDNDAKDKRDFYLGRGFEGIVLRDPEGMYELGKRSHYLTKYKKWETTKCLVIDIIPKPLDTHLPLFVCKNDITDDIFECVPMGSHAKQAKLLREKEKYIGTYVEVKFYERTINNLPFNANVLEIK